MGARVKHLNKYLTYMADIQIKRNPLAKQVTVILQDVTRDQYQDAIVNEIGRIRKYAMVSKQLDMNYVQEWGDPSLLEDVDNPWIITLTVTDFIPRIPRMDDQIVIDGIKYSISEVRPSNREIDGIILLKVYPERNASREEFAVESYSVTDGIMHMNVAGSPKDMFFCICLSDNSVYKLPVIPYHSTIAIPGTRYRFSFCDSVSVRYSECYWNPVTGVPEFTIPDGCPNLVERVDFVAYEPYSGDTRPVFVTVDGTIPDRDSLLYSAPFPMGPWYRVYVCYGDQTLHFDNNELRL